MRTVAIHQPQYLPYLGFFHKLMNCEIFVLLDDAQFQKGGVQNRNKIKTSQGWQWITVPVRQRSTQLISEVEINQEVPWQRKHLNALESNYAPSRFFDRYKADFQRNLNQEWSALSSLNTALTRWVMDVLGIETPIVFSSELDNSESGTARLIQICRQLGGTKYLSGPGGKNYMDLDAFARAGIEVVWQDFTAPVYEQVFPEAGFVPDLSVVDALFCCGPDTVQLLRN